MIARTPARKPPAKKKPASDVPPEVVVYKDTVSPAPGLTPGPEADHLGDALGRALKKAFPKSPAPATRPSPSDAGRSGSPKSPPTAGPRADIIVRKVGDALAREPRKAPPAPESSPPPPKRAPLKPESPPPARETPNVEPVRKMPPAAARVETARRSPAPRAEVAPRPAVAAPRRPEPRAEVVQKPGPAKLAPPEGKPVQPEPPTQAAKAASAAEVVRRATNSLVETLYKEAGIPGSLLEHPQGRSFTLSPEFAEGAVHTNGNLLVPLSPGWTVPHAANVTVDLEGGRHLYVDILDGHESVDRAKILAFDALHLKRSPKKVFAVLVFIRPNLGGLQQEQVEAICQAYDYIFGIDEHNVGLGSKFAACKSEVIKWTRGGA